ncbi:LexA family protein [Staphylococcus hominis]|uniref:LexA family protein n=1 Tax=Staphylococcus hominis TaxID=1290 RepID=UPI002DB599BA|nr:XRE family transcriptional regulator [Staphylococcus hominis]MEB5793930.1 XRE family transcriptional regulator [Staphylococcus hominis]
MDSKLKERRKELGLTLEQVGEIVGVGKSTVRKWETGDIENMKRDKIAKLAKALKVSPAFVMGFDEDEEEKENNIQTLPVKEIPIVSQISAGLPIYAEENILEHTYIATKKLNTNKEIFGLRVNGDSMDKEFRDGDVVIVEKDAVVENGQIAVVQVNGYNATVKRVRYEKDRIILIPESNNSAHYPQVYSQDDEVKIIGKVVSSQKFY